MKRTLKFIDADNQLVTGEIEIEKCNEEHTSYLTLKPIKITNKVHIDCDLRDFKPATEEQERLKSLIDSKKFRDFFAGTKKQMDYINSDKYNDDFDKIVKFSELNEHDFIKTCEGHFDVDEKTVNAAINHVLEFDFNTSSIMDYISSHKSSKNDYCIELFLLTLNGLVGDRGYMFGTGWLYNEIKQEDIDEFLSVAHDVFEEYKSMQSDITEYTEEQVEELCREHGLGRDLVIAACALSIAFKHDIGQVIDDIITGSRRYFTYLGNSYYIGTDEQLEKCAKSYLTDDPFLWQEAVAAGDTTDSLNDWAQWVVDMDGFSSILNTYDGDCRSYDVDGKDIYVVPTDHSTSILA